MKNMNKIFLMLAGLGMLVASCTNEPVEISRNTKITISPEDVLDDFTPFKSGDLEMLENEDYGLAKLRINAYIYDENGDLVMEQEGLIDDYFESYTFEVQLDAGKTYTLLSFSSSIFGSLNRPELEAYEFSKVKSLSSFTVTQVSEESYYSTWSILGGSRTIINASEEDEVKVKHEAITSLVYLLFGDIHANGGSSSSVYGEYTATATDYWEENTYEWTISVEPGSAEDEVVINGFDPFFAKEGKGSNSFVGYLYSTEGYDFIIIPDAQKMGAYDDNGDIYLHGGEVDTESQTFEYGNINIWIEESGRLTVLNMFGSCVDKTIGWYSLFNAGVQFEKSESYSAGVDEYAIIYHNNDQLGFDAAESEFTYETALDDKDNNGVICTPSNNPNSYSIYEMINLLPGEFDTYARVFIGNDMEDYSRQEITVEQGCQYVLELDCATMDLSFDEGELKSKSIDVFNRAVRKGPVVTQYQLYPEPKRLILKK